MLCLCGLSPVNYLFLSFLALVCAAARRCASLQPWDAVDGQAKRVGLGGTSSSVDKRTGGIEKQDGKDEEEKERSKKNRGQKGGQLFIAAGSAGSQAAAYRERTTHIRERHWKAR
jgi:hypothetical protein